MANISVFSFLVFNLFLTKILVAGHVELEVLGVG